MAELTPQNGSARGGRRVASSRALPKIAVIVGGVVLVCLVVFAGYVASYDKILPGVTLGGLDVGGMTLAEAQTHIADNLHTDAVGVKLSWTLDDEQSQTDISLAAVVDAEQAATAAYNTGRDGGIFAKMGAFFGSKTAEYTANINQDDITAAVGEVAGRIDRPVADYAANVRDGQIHFTMGSNGYTLDGAAATAHIRSSLDNVTFGDGASLDLSPFIVHSQPQPLDVDKLYQNVHTPSSEAHYEYKENPDTGKKIVEVVQSDKGYAFDVEQAKSLLANNKDFSLPVTEVEPEVSSDNLSEMLFRDKIGEATTTLNKWNYNRTGNVKLAADSINEVVLAPGDEFSYNNALGKRTYERGYREASVYVSTGIEDQLGGGICQVSSTLYMATIRARLEIVERRNHAYTVPYTPLGEDATVYWGSIDFRFKNNFDFPVKLVSWQQDDYITVELWGTKNDDAKMEVECVVHSSNPYKTVQRDNPNLDFGKTKQVVEGHSGYSVTTYAVIKDADGNQIDKYRLSDSRYKRLDRVLDVGTKGAPAAEVPPEEQPVGGQPETVPPVTPPDGTVPPVAPPDEMVPPVTSPVETEQPVMPPVETTPPVEEPLNPAIHD